MQAHSGCEVFITGVDQARVRADIVVPVPGPSHVTGVTVVVEGGRHLLVGEPGRTRPRVLGDRISHRFADDDRLAVVSVVVQGRNRDGRRVVPLRHPIVVMEVKKIQPLARPEIIILPTPFHARRPNADRLLDGKVQSCRHVVHVGPNVG